MALIFEGTIDKFAEEKNLTFLTKADSIEELAEKVDLPDLRKTIKQYNAAAENGEDTEFEKPSNYLQSIEKGRPINGLYAAGSDASGVFSWRYVWGKGTWF